MKQINLQKNGKRAVSKHFEPVFILGKAKGY